MEKAMEVQIINFQSHGDERGELIALDAHKNLRQVLFCPCGSCTNKLDSGRETVTVRLSNPTEGLVVEANTWREMYDFTPEAVLMVLASDYYDESDYIRDYDEFLQYVGACERKKG